MQIYNWVYTNILFVFVFNGVPILLNKYSRSVNNYNNKIQGISIEWEHGMFQSDGLRLK